MASLYRLDVIVRGNSSATQDYAVEWTKGWVNDRQEADKNKDENGEYISDFYADLFDSRTNKAWKVFSDEAANSRSIDNAYVKEDGSIIEGVIYTTPFGEMVDDLNVRLSFVEEQLRDGETTSLSGVKILV